MNLRRWIGTAAGVLAVAALAGCRRRELYSTVEHPATGGEIHYCAEGMTRPAVELAGGWSKSWTIPAGPERLLRTAFYSESKDGVAAEGKLRARLFPPAGKALQWEAKVRWVVGRPPGWQEWRLRIPASGAPERLTFEYLSSQAGSGPGIAVASPTIAVPGGALPKIFVFFDVDTLRRDRVSAYGYKLPTTPRIDRFFSDGTRFDRAYSNSPWTLPSHATIFTSTLPNRHGVGERLKSLPEDLPTLAETLSKAGYRTIAVTNGGYVDPSFGFDRGFDVYTVSGEGVGKRVRDALDLIDRYQGEPIFLFFHTYQVHEYAPTEQSARALFGSVDALGPKWAESVGKIFGNGSPAASVSKWLGRRYDAAVRATDDGFGELVEGLARRGLRSSTGILLTSDHGEEIFDRPGPRRDEVGSFGHIHPHLYDEYLAVPLFLKLPWKSVSPRAISEEVSLLDIAPTILRSLGLPPPAGFQGRSFLEGATGSELIVSKAPRYDAVALRRSGKKIILRSGFPFVSWEDGSDFGRLPVRECFDIDSDPREELPLSCEAPWARDLELEAERYIAATFPGAVVVRFPGLPAGSPPRDLAIRARGRKTPPHAFWFGVAPSSEFWTRGNAAEGRFQVGESPAWVAFRPDRTGEALDLDLFGEPGLAQGAFSWGSLLWRSERLLPKRPVLFSTAPGELASRAGERPVAVAVVERLRSLGYLSAGLPGESRPVGAASAVATGRIGRIAARDGELVLRTHTAVPLWRPPPPPRLIAEIVPSATRAGELFNEQLDGSSAVALLGEGFTREDRVYWDNRPLTTTFGTARFISARVPPSLTARPGTARVEIRGTGETTLSAEFTILERPAR